MLNLEKVNYFCYNQTLSARIHEQKSHRFQIGFKNLVLASGYLFSDMAHFAAIFLRKNKSTSEINSDWKRIRQKYYQFFINEKFKKNFICLPVFYLLMCLMKPSKNFEKISIFEMWQLVSFWGVKIHFGEIPLKRYIFRNVFFCFFSPILPL